VVAWKLWPAWRRIKGARRKRKRENGIEYSSLGQVLLAGREIDGILGL
jgi:hypothetical protein